MSQKRDMGHPGFAHILAATLGNLMEREERLEMADERAALMHRIERLQETVCYLLARNEELRARMREENFSRED